MIHAPCAHAGATSRILEGLTRRGLELSNGDSPGREQGATLLLWTPVDWMRLGVWLGLWRAARGARLVVLSRVGSHPDARARSLRDLWQLEEHARVSLIPTLVLRLGPLVGEQSPFWLQLGSRPRLRAEGRSVVMPVLEEDALAAVECALREPHPAEGWYEIIGPDARALDEWAEIAGGLGGSPTAVAGTWEPALDELVEHRLSEPEIWQERFGVAARSVVEWARKA